MTWRLFVRGEAGARRLALCEDARLVEYAVERAAAAGEAGSIHRGRTLRIDRGLEAAFVDVGLARPGLLPLADAAGRPNEGDAVIVQVVREAEADKGARLTGKPSLPGFLVTLTPGRPGVEGLVARRAAKGADTATIGREAEMLRAAWRRIEAGPGAPACLHRDHDVVTRMLRDRGPVDEVVFDRRADLARCREAIGDWPGFAGTLAWRPARQWVPGVEEIEEQVAAALESEVPLPGGGSLIVEPGRTLTAIDVNSGAGRQGRQALLDTNLAAAAEVARQLRLRNIGGIVVVDFIDLKSAADRRRTVEALRLAAAGDPAYCWVGAMSRLGLVEMTRERRGPSLKEALTKACREGGGEVER